MTTDDTDHTDYTANRANETIPIGVVMAFLPDTNLWIFLLKNPGGKLDAKVQSQLV